jgi:hypothetical protein
MRAASRGGAEHEAGGGAWRAGAQRARFAEKLDVAGVDDVVAAGDKNSNHAPLWRSRLAPREKSYPPVSQPMHFSDWQSLAPAPAAREFLRRAPTLL